MICVNKIDVLQVEDLPEDKKVTLTVENKMFAFKSKDI